MELRHLRYFIAVAEELHFGRAAERLFIAQPPLSQQIMQLERELGFGLFTRTKRHVELTPAGRLFLDEARELLSDLESAVGSARRIAYGKAGRLRIGFVGSATYEVMPAALRIFRVLFPDVELTLRELASGRQAQALRDKRIDVGLARPPIEEPGILSAIVIRELLVAAVPASHRLAAQRTVSMADLAEEPFILFPRHPKPSYADFLISVCEGAGFPPNVVQEAAEMHTAIGLVAAGIGVTLVPQSVCTETRQGLVFRKIKPAVASVELAAASRAGDDSPVVREFLDVVRTIYNCPVSGQCSKRD